MWIYLPFVIQGAVMMVDEFHFHEKRGLPRFEKIGHPLDSLSVLMAYSFLAFNEYNSIHLRWYLYLCVFSCLLITKDEFIHHDKCEAKEQWLHSLLFLLHPLTFLCAGILWKEDSSNLFLKVQPVVVGVFMLYQIFRWSLPWPQKK